MVREQMLSPDWVVVRERMRGRDWVVVRERMVGLERLVVGGGSDRWVASGGQSARYGGRMEPVVFTAAVDTVAGARVAFDRVVPRDDSDLFTGYLVLPAVTGVTDQTGSWTVPGSRRTVHLSDGGTFREHLLHHTPPPAAPPASTSPSAAPPAAAMPAVIPPPSTPSAPTSPTAALPGATSPTANPPAGASPTPASPAVGPDGIAEAGVGVFDYRVTDFTGALSHLVSEATARWRYEPTPTGSRIRWTYEYVPLPRRRFVVERLIGPIWRRYMTRSLAVCARVAEGG
ncbi:hypothetical protein ACEXQD_10805 [Herbiconiux sp. P15]|uniref:hypothetical protein n=1 Tax=Herbiconiux liukaitaii TaxID=3342799 RepID=UPI0035B9C802